MPGWGLTPEQRSSKPWDLPEELLTPAKTLTDPIHGDIFLNRLEQSFLDGPPLQRLRRVRQLGTTHLVYPGATHSRLSHSLGALRASQDLLDTVLIQRNGPRPARDLFTEWQADLDPEKFDKRVAEATVLARLGALLHDLCHVPFGHSIEDDIHALMPHDENRERFERLWSQFPDNVRNSITPRLKAALTTPLILKGDLPAELKPYEFVADIVGNTICADLLDYLRRDHLFAGLPASLGSRFLAGFYVTCSDDPQHPRRMVVRTGRDGRPRQDVISEMFKHLRYRYELSERALVHHAKLAADAMVGKMLELWRDAACNRIAAELAPEISEYEKDIHAAIRSQDETNGGDLQERVGSAVNGELETLFLRHGDDGLLEQIVLETEGSSDKRKRAVFEIATGLMDRHLYKPIGQTRQTALAESLYERYGGKAGRVNKRELEIEVAREAGLEEGWHVVIWLPRPDMRMKLAGVLVDDGDSIAELRETNIGENRGREIYDAHKGLWAMSVYVHPKVNADPEKCDVVLALLAKKLGRVKWHGREQQPSIERRLVERVRRTRPCTSEQEKQLLAIAGDLAAHGSSNPNAFEQMARQLEVAAAEILDPQRDLFNRSAE